MDVDRGLLILEEYIRDNIPEPDIKVGEYLFTIQTFSKWAVNEILERVIRESMKLPAHVSGKERMSVIDIVDSFIDEMDYYEAFSTDWKAKEMFSIAGDEGRCVLLYIGSFN